MMLPAADIPYRMEQSFFFQERTAEMLKPYLFVSCATYLFRFAVI
jgi:hypothetical protein